jgi:hypothetical protein
MTWDRDYLHALQLSSYAAEYERHLSRFRDLDSKSQSVSTVCGILLAAALAAVAAEPKSKVGDICLGIVAVLLSVALGLALGAMQVQEVEDAPSTEGMGRVAADVLGMDEQPAAELNAAFHNELFAFWQSSVASIRAANERKSGYVQGAQLIVAAIGVLATIAVGLILLTRGMP